MVFFCDANGVIKNVIPEKVFQGSAGVNKVVFVGAFPSSSQVLMAFQLPNGIWTPPTMLTHTAELEGVTTKDGKAYSGWVGLIGATPQIDENGKIVTDDDGHVLYNLDFSVTENYGECMVQFYVYTASTALTITERGTIKNNGGAMLATAKSSFTIEQGVPALVPDENEMQDNWAQLLRQILSLEANREQTIANNYKEIQALNDKNIARILLIPKAANGEIDIIAYNKDNDDVFGTTITVPYLTNLGGTATGAITIKHGELETKYDAGGIQNAGHGLTLPQKDGTLATQDDVIDAVSNVVRQLFEPVDALPEEGQGGKIYLVPIVDGETPNLYEEWIWTANGWESLGTTAIDLSVLEDYVKKTDYGRRNKPGIVAPGIAFTFDEDGNMELVSNTATIQQRVNCAITGSTMETAWKECATHPYLKWTDEDYEKFYAFIGAVQDYHERNRNGIARFENGHINMTEPTADSHGATQKYVKARVENKVGAAITEMKNYADGRVSAERAGIDAAIATAKTKTRYGTYTNAHHYPLAIGGWYMAFSSDSSLKICKADGAEVVSGARHMIFMSVPYSETEKDKFVVMGMYFYDGTFSITNPKVPMEFFQVQVDKGSYITAASSATFNVSERVEDI